MVIGVVGVLAITSILAVAPADCETTALKDKFIMFDEYVLKTGVLYVGGQLRISCKSDTLKSACVSPNYYQVLGPDGQEVARHSCDGTGRWGHPMVKITKEMQFGEYKCVYSGDKLSKPFSIDFRLCADDEKACQDDCADNTKFCIVTGNGVAKSCTSLNEQTCESFKESGWNRPCPPFNHNGSICAALANKYSNVRYDGGPPMEVCPAEENGPRISFGSGQPRTLYRETFKLDRADAVAKIDYKQEERLRAFNLTCEIRSRTSDFKKTHEFPRHVKTGQFDIKEIFEHGSDLYRLHCFFYSAPTTGKYSPETDGAVFSYNLVVFEGTVTVAVSDAEKGKKLECKLDPPPAGLFQASYTWKAEKSDTSQFTTSDITVTESDKYTCNVLLTYKTCRPHATFSETFHSEEMEVKSAVQVFMINDALLIALCSITRMLIRLVA